MFNNNLVYFLSVMSLHSLTKPLRLSLMPLPIQRHTGSPLHTGEWISNQKEVVFGYTTRLCLSCPSEFQAVYD